MYNQTSAYFTDRKLTLLAEGIENLKDRGKPDEAAALARSYKAPATTNRWLRADEITELHWENVIPRNELMLLAGNKGMAKSQITLSDAAITTTGGKWPDGRNGRARDVLIISAEDSAEQIIKPRLIAAGANHERCYILNQTDEHNLLARQ